MSNEKHNAYAKNRRKIEKFKLSEQLNKLENEYKALKTLSQFAFYKIEIASIPMTGWFLNNLLNKYAVESLSFGGKLYSGGDVKANSSMQICHAHGVWFMFTEQKDALERFVSTKFLYVPIWQRNKVHEVLKVLYKELLPKPSIYSLLNGNGIRSDRPKYYPPKLGEQRQYVRKDVYDRVDTIFKRLIENPAYYTTADKRLKETFMLHGEPGTGKTSLIMHMGAKHGLNIAITSPSDWLDNPSSVLHARSVSVDKPFIILMEDIDSEVELLKEEFRNTVVKVSTVDNSPDFNYSTFINKMDGGIGLENVFLFLTTNYRDRLIPSIYRPGRVDHCIELVSLTSEEIALEVNNEVSDYIRAFDDGTFTISNIADLRLSTTHEHVDEIVKWIKA